MNLSLQTCFKASCFWLLLIVLGVSCSKYKKPKDDIETKPTAAFTAKIDGADYAIEATDFSSTYYTTSGDDIKALLTTATLNTNGSKITFFVNDFKPGTAVINKKTGTSSNPGNPRLKVDAVTNSVVQSYVQYISGGNTYYAVSGSITVSLSGNTATIKFNITFTDAAGKSFTATGSYTINDFTTNTKPKSQITDPTPIVSKPTIENISPLSGFIADTVSITGTNYSATLTENIVKFNGTDAKVVSAISTTIKVTVPASATTGVVTLKVKDNDVITGPMFTISSPATITSISPTSGRAGDTVTINGTNFNSSIDGNRVRFNNAGAVIISATPTKIKVKAALDGSTGNVTVTVGSSATVTGPVFTYLNLPQVQFLSPYQGRAGDTIVIQGYYFGGTPAANIVKFNGIQANVLTAAGTALKVIAPQGVTSGRVTVTVNGKTSTDSAPFTVNPPYPNIKWQEIFYSSGLENINQMASLRNGLLVTGAAVTSSLFFSADDKTFTNVYNNLPFNKNSKVIIHLLSQDGKAFYVTSNLGVAKSTDGVNWTKLTPDKNNPDKGFTGIVSTSERLMLVSGSTTYTSLDAGTTWTTAGNSQPAQLDYFTSFPNSKYIFAIDTAKNTASHNATKLYSSIDKGTTWNQSYSSVTGIYHFNEGCRDFLKTTNYSLYCAFSPVSNPGLADQKLYRSVNQGYQWDLVGNETCFVVKTFGVNVAYGSQTFNLSTNDGTTFKSFALPQGYSYLGGIELGSYIYITVTNLSGTHIFRSSW
ncbi:IPT/TIG domain-containing protein [Mucilaginibacter gossypii]|uniref:IPT/TIG domain-containing protein n=1 Tax=Mucilaginibacter gossypii TaxID=551996 RepID=A0A1G8JYY1_9SPHI|nr:IPT/TIG domain-containing protein [Mucilaginibacter gossypii]SDI36317.1 IPT/TIG domain-containing protein [Mucilaginibacter gossypii]